ncbi:hypothetical protein CRYUN_Cryun09bG0167900 [Craigia yunnanensis]
MIITIVTTPHNATRFKTIIDYAIESRLSIRLVELWFQCVELRLLEGCENFDMFPSLSLALKLFQAANMLQELVKIARGNKATAKLYHFKLVILEHITSNSHYFSLPNMSDKVEFTKLQLPIVLNNENLKEFCEKTLETDIASYGVVINTFEELKHDISRNIGRKERPSDLRLGSPSSNVVTQRNWRVPNSLWMEFNNRSHHCRYTWHYYLISLFFNVFRLLTRALRLLALEPQK